MLETTATNSQGESNSPAGVASAQVEGDEANLTETEQAEGEENAEGTQPTEEELEELEHEGKKYRIPKPIKAGFMMQQDYTTKTQKLAEEKRAWEQQRDQHAQRDGEYLRDVGRVVTMNEQIAQFEAFDWSSVPPEKQAEAQAALIQYQQLKIKRDNAIGALQKRERERQAETQRETAKRLDEAKAAIAKEIPGWNADLAGKLFTMGNKDFSFSAEELNAISDPRMMKVLHRAYLGEQAIKKLAAIERAKSSEEVKPVTQVGSNAGANARRTTDASGDRLSADEWVKRERERLAKKR